MRRSDERRGRWCSGLTSSFLSLNFGIIVIIIVVIETDIGVHVEEDIARQLKLHDGIIIKICPWTCWAQRKVETPSET